MYKKTCKDYSCMIRSEPIRKEMKSRRSGDRDSNRTPMTPLGNLTAYGYDSHNRLSKVGPSENNSDASYSYNKIGRLAESTLKRRNFYLFIELIGLECIKNYQK